MLASTELETVTLRALQTVGRRSEVLTAATVTDPPPESSSSHQPSDGPTVCAETVEEMSLWGWDFFRGWYPLEARDARPTRVIQNYGYHQALSFEMDRERREREYAILFDAASINKKVVSAVQSVFLPPHWKYSGDPDGLYTDTSSDVTQHLRPLEATMDFKQIMTFFAAFEGLLLDRFDTVPHEIRRCAIEEFKDCCKYLSSMIKSIEFSAEPLVFFHENWPILCYIFDKLCQVVHFFFLCHLLTCS
jgi:hypothetical protein